MSCALFIKYFIGRFKKYLSLKEKNGKKESFDTVMKKYFRSPFWILMIVEKQKKKIFFQKTWESKLEKTRETFTKLFLKNISSISF